MRFWLVLLAVLLVAAPFGASTAQVEVEAVSFAHDDDVSIAPVSLALTPERVRAVQATGERATLAPPPTGDPVFRPPRAG